jgi:hypothetical protein
MPNDFNFDDILSGFQNQKPTLKSTGTPKLDEAITKCVELNKQIQAI